MTTQRGSSAAWVRGILEMMAAEGLATDQLCVEADIDLAALQHPQTRVDVDRVSCLWELAVTHSGKTAFGLNRQLAARFGNVDLVGYSLASGPSLMAGFQDLQRHMAVISDATSFVLERDARGYWLSVHHIGAKRPVPRQRLEFSMLTLLVLCSWLTRCEVLPLAVEFIAGPPPANCEADYLTAFGLVPRYGQEANRMLLAQADLLFPIPTHNPELWALHEKLVESELDQLGQTAGVSYQQLLDDTRRELAMQYLGDPRHSLAQVADMLGFVDQSNLFRACRRWFGMPPGQYRQQLRP